MVSYTKICRRAFTSPTDYSWEAPLTFHGECRPKHAKLLSRRETLSRKGLAKLLAVGGGGRRLPRFSQIDEFAK